MNRIEIQESRSGVLCGIAAYGSWGLIPLYFKAVASVPPLEILAHRALWSFVVLGLMVTARGRWGELRKELRNRKLLLMLGLSTIFIAGNWLLFIYAVASGQVLQASLGYFINPLVNVLLGTAILGERLRPRQTFSLGLALGGVLLLVAFLGEIPWIALALAMTFAFYGLMRKIIPLDGLLGLTVETLAMAPIALVYIGGLNMAKYGAADGLKNLGLLALSGPVTTVPLLFFAAAAKRLQLSTMGFLQYLSPTLQFLLAVLAFGEPFATAQILSFACIWAAVAVFATDSFRAVGQYHVEVLEPD